MTTLADRLAAVDAAIADSARAAGRDAAAIRLVAISKRVSVDSILEAVEAGQREFGENYLQEAVQKQDAIDRHDLSWHLVGHLQSNKARRAFGRFALIHGLSSLSAAVELSRAGQPGGIPCRVLLQVHLGGGQDRSGIRPQQAVEFARSVTALPHLSLEGVMGVAPPGCDARRSFAQLREVLEDLQSRDLPAAPLREMSAGMSSDFRDAILEGATIVRIGTAIFGERSAA